MIFENGKSFVFACTSCKNDGWFTVFLKQVKYSVDAIDESDIIEEILKPRIGMINGSLEKITINGNHITPCVQVKLV